MRSGASKSEVAARPRQAWKAKLGGKLSAITVAGGRAFVAEVEEHAVCALDSRTGDVLWRYTAGGRVDTPPTVVNVRGAGELCVFGCRDGWVYCVQAADGALVWRHRAAETERRIVSYDQIESAWPVSGAVLVQDGAAYCVAGRSMFLDGGLRLVKLDVLTGELKLEEVMGDTIPGSGKPLHTTARGLDMPVALPDILSSDGKLLYMRSQTIGLDGKRGELFTTRAADQGGEQAHLVCSSGFLDDTWFHRAYWVFGRGYGTGHNGWFRAGRFAPAGRMLVFNDDAVFAYGRRPGMYVWSSALEYELRSMERDMKPADLQRVLAANKKQESRGKGGHGHGITFDRKLYGSFPLKEISALEYNWRNEKPRFLARAMALAGDKLFVAGPPDLVDEEEIFAKPFDEGVIAKAAEQTAAFKGARGSILLAVASADGKTLSEINLESCPVFDGLPVAEGAVYVSMMDGSVICFR